jgi:hypothetical protein
VTASEGQPPAEGRRDPKTKQPLFTPITKDAIRNAKEKAIHVQDPLPFDQMYAGSKPGAGAKHNCLTYYSQRGDSLLEVWHLLCQHYGNIGMREDVANALMLRGTAWHNVTVRFKKMIRQMSPEERKNILACYHSVPLHMDHSALSFINDLASQKGALNVPHPNACHLPDDNGERFFSEYLRQQEERNMKVESHRKNSRCQCSQCANAPTPLPHELEIVTGSRGEGNGMTSANIMPTLSAVTMTQEVTTEGVTEPTQEAAAPPVRSIADTWEPSQATKGMLLEQFRVHREINRFATTTSVPESTLHPPAILPRSTQPILPGFLSLPVPTNLWQPQGMLFPSQFQAFHPNQMILQSAPRKRKTPEKEYCCEKYRAYFDRPDHRGRPPHNDSCINCGRI